MFNWSLASILSLLQGKTSLKIVASDWLKTSSFDWLKLLSSECGTGALQARLYRRTVYDVSFLDSVWHMRLQSCIDVVFQILLLDIRWCNIWTRNIGTRQIFSLLLLDDAVSNLFFFAGNFLLLGWSGCVGGFNTTILVGFCCLETLGGCIFSWGCLILFLGCISCTVQSWNLIFGFFHNFLDVVFCHLLWWFFLRTIFILWWLRSTGFPPCILWWLVVLYCSSRL